jgi:hypothetical protein
MLFLHLSVDFVVADLDGHYVIQIQNAWHKSKSWSSKEKMLSVW